MSLLNFYHELGQSNQSPGEESQDHESISFMAVVRVLDGLFQEYKKFEDIEEFLKIMSNNCRIKNPGGLSSQNLSGKFSDSP